jgi:DNA-binding LacI/PurR family transcriptional regulator
MGGSVTQKAVAMEAGVDVSTVSLALRRDPRLKPSTCERVLAAAERLGYRPNPLFSLVMSRVRRRDAGYRGTLAYIHSGLVRRRDLGEIPRNFLSGARRRAAQLGYRVDEFHLSQQEAIVERLARVLTARSISGLVLEHFYPGFPGRRFPVAISEFAVAGIGIPFTDPGMHYVANDQYMRPIVAARELLALGYRRPGLVMAKDFDAFMSHRCSAGFFSLQEHAAGMENVPILWTDNADCSLAIRRWLRRHRPDVILAPRISVLNQIRASGLRVPRDVGFAHLDWLPAFAPVAGVFGNSEHTGALAVEIVVSQLLRGERGPPAFPVSHLVAGVWKPGSTVRRVGDPLNLDERFSTVGFSAEPEPPNTSGPQGARPGANTRPLKLLT